MSPTVFRSGKYRAFFFSREESRMHVHLTCPEGEAKVWLSRFWRWQFTLACQLAS
jgi:hypothetical protein